MYLLSSIPGYVYDWTMSKKVVIDELQVGGFINTEETRDCLRISVSLWFLNVAFYVPVWFQVSMGRGNLETLWQDKQLTNEKIA